MTGDFRTLRLVIVGAEAVMDRTRQVSTPVPAEARAVVVCQLLG
ncbi:hypothetical protein ACVWVY_001687 [Bradyrhizobium sp. URHC0002]